MVANHYQPQHSLIGPTWFPTYVFVLKIVGLWCAIPWLITSVVIHRFQDPASNWSSTLVGAGMTVEHAEELFGTMFPPDSEPANVLEPSKEALDFSPAAIAAQAVLILRSNLRFEH